MTWITSSRVDQDNHLIDGKWNHVLFSCDKGASARTLSLYINGNLVESKSAGNATSFATADDDLFMIAGKDRSSAGTSNYTSYKLDSINFFTTTMSASEVENIFNYGALKTRALAQATLLTTGLEAIQATRSRVQVPSRRLRKEQLP